MKKILNKYQNGNVLVTIFDDGTKMYENELDYFDFDSPIFINCKITERCPFNCDFCYEKSSINGKNGEIMKKSFIDTLPKGTEINLEGGATTMHPQLIPFLEKLKKQGIIANITANQLEYEANKPLIEELIEKNLINSLRVSFVSFNDKLWNEILKNKNVIVSLIAGLHGGDVFDYFANKNVKILILGYKDFGKGKDFKEQAEVVINIQQKWLKNNIEDIISRFDFISFDNLAIEQLEIKKILNLGQQNNFFREDTDFATIYVDLVNQLFAKNSTSINKHPLLSNIEDMYKIIKFEK